MIDHYHPNFPPNLSITPNVGCFTNNVPFEGHGGDAFGAEAQREAISKYGIAGRVWEAAYALCTYIECDAHDFDPPFVDNFDDPIGVIELGSGAGLLAASIARTMRRTADQGSLVIATDLLDVCPLLQHNLGINSASSGHSNTDRHIIYVRPLAWGNLDHATAITNEFGFDHARRLTHIVCSDLIYFPELLGPLLRTLIHLTSPPCVSSMWIPALKVVISYKIRSILKETPFWTAFGLWFSFQPVLVRRRVWPIGSTILFSDDEPESWRQFGADDDSDRMFVFVGHRRPESIAWNVPDTDQELMEGVGAQATTTKKGDDLFETILLMAMGIDDKVE